MLRRISLLQVRGQRVRCVRGFQRSVFDPMLDVQRGVASMLNGTAERLGFRYRVSIDDDTSIKVKDIEKEPIKRERRLNKSLRFMAQKDIEAYANRLVSSGQLSKLEGLPHTAAVERFVYTHCVKILLCLVHEALDRLEGSVVWGDLCLTQIDYTARAKIDLLASLENRLKRTADQRILVDVRAISKFVDNVILVESERSNGDSTPSQSFPRFERLLHYNVSNIVLNLMADLFSTFQFDFFGHSVKLQVQPNDILNSVDLPTLRAHRDRPHRLIFDDSFVNALTDEILNDKQINLWLIPDSLERSFYRRFFSFYGILLDYTLSDLRLSVLDLQAKLHLERR